MERRIGGPWGVEAWCDSRRAHFRVFWKELERSKRIGMHARGGIGPRGRGREIWAVDRELNTAEMIV